MDGLSSGVWDRQRDSVVSGSMSRNLYALMVCFWTALGIGTSAGFARYAEGWQLGWPQMILILVVSIAGVMISVKSDNPLVSLFGYALIVVPFGLMLGPLVAAYTAASVFKALFLTTMMVVVLGVIGAMIPDSLAGWGSWLFGGLLLLLGGLILVPIAGFLGVPVEGAMTLLDWVGVVIFGGLVLYDLNRAMRLEYTMDNAIDSAVAIYLDFVNIFIRLLSLLGVRRD